MQKRTVKNHPKSDVESLRRGMLRPGRVLAGLSLSLMMGLSSAVLAAPDRVEVETAYLSRGVYVPATVVIPLAGADQTLPLVVMAHGHGGDRDEAGAFRQLASKLAQAGIASIRMDFSGCGDNPDPFTENNLGNMLQDISAARKFALGELPVNPDRVAILGYSIGGRLAVLATQGDSYSALAVWAPAALDGAAAMFPYVGGTRAWRHLKGEAERDGSASFITPWGQEQLLGLRWFIDLEQSQPEQVIGRYPGPVFILHGEEDENMPPENSRALVQAAKQSRGVESHFIEGADHGLGFYTGHAELSAKVIDLTANFLTSELLEPDRTASPQP